MPNEEPTIPGSENELLLQLVSALINHGQPQVEQPALNTRIPGAQQLHDLSRAGIPPQNLFAELGATLGLAPSGQIIPPQLQQQQHFQQLPNVGSSMDLEATHHYDEMPQCLQGDRGQANALEKRERIRLKNRLAQQRFRERRRALQRQAQDQFDTIAAEYDALELENEALREQEQALFKLYHVKHAFIGTFLAIKQSTKAHGDVVVKEKEKDAVVKDVVKEEKESNAAAAGGGGSGGSDQDKEKQTSDVNLSGADTSSQHQPLARLLQIPNRAPGTSLQGDAQIMAIIKAWQLQLGELMESATSSGFAAEKIKILAAATQRQLVEWQELAQKDSFEYSKMLHHVLAPPGTSSPNNKDVDAGMLAPETLAVVVGGIPADGLEELKKINAAYEANMDLGQKALRQWKNELLPLLVLSYSADMDANTSSMNEFNQASGNAFLISAHGLSTRHIMSVAAMAHLQAVAKKVWDAVGLIGPAWSRVAGPLNASLCHLEAAPYVPSPDVLTKSILALAAANLNQSHPEQEKQ